MRFRLLVLGLGVLLAAGCSSMDSPSLPQTLRERFNGPTYQTKVVDAEQRKTYEAAKAGLKEIGFRFVNGGPNQGKLSGINDVVSSDDFRGARQLTVDVKLTPVPDGTEVAILFSETVEDDFNKHPGMGVTSPLKNHGLYEVYFRAIERALGAPSRP